MTTPEQIMARGRLEVLKTQDRLDAIALEAFLREDRRQSSFMAKLKDLIGSIGRKK